MFKKRNAQGLSITTIIIAVIGLIVVIVLVAIFSGRLGQFGQGLDEASTCDSLCTSQNLNFQPDTIRNDCNDPDGLNGRVLFGTFGDVKGGIDAVPNDPNTAVDESQPFKPFVCCCTAP